MTTSAAAQVHLHVDAGMGDARDLQGANVAVAPSLGWTGRWWSVNGSGRYASRGDAGSALMGELEALGWLRLTHGLAIDAGWSGRQRSLSWARDASGWDATLGLSLEGGGGGTRLVLGRGQAQRSLAHVPLSSAEGTVWRQFGLVQIEILGRQTTLGEPVPRANAPGDSLQPGGGEVDSNPAHQFARYTDLGGTVRSARGAFSGSLALGHRFSPVGGGGWWRVEGLMWLTSRLGLVLQGGHNPPDLKLGTGGGRFTTLAFRVSLNGSSPVAHHRASRPGAEGRSLLLTRQPGGGTSLAIRAPGAGRVELMADFTDWLPVDLVPREVGWFDLAIPVPPGTHPVNVRYDGGAWTPPPGSPTIQDEFGGEVGVVRGE
ncbi:MAG: glycogen-binding domain-containing protein [Gemmatimonadales bacterium]